MTDDEKNKIIRVKDVALILDCSPEAVRRLARRKQLKSFSVSRPGARDNFRFKRCWVDEFMESQANGQPEGTQSDSKDTSPTQPNKIRQASVAVGLSRHSEMNLS